MTGIAASRCSSALPALLRNTAGTSMPELCAGCASWRVVVQRAEVLGRTRRLSVPSVRPLSRALSYAVVRCFAGAGAGAGPAGEPQTAPGARRRARQGVHLPALGGGRETLGGVLSGSGWTMARGPLRLLSQWGGACPSPAFSPLRPLVVVQEGPTPERCLKSERHRPHPRPPAPQVRA